MMMDVAQLDKDTADSIDTWVSHSLLKLLHLCYGLLMLIVDIYIYIYIGISLKVRITIVCV